MAGANVNVIKNVSIPRRLARAIEQLQCVLRQKKTHTAAKAAECYLTF